MVIQGDHLSVFETGSNYVATAGLDFTVYID